MPSITLTTTTAEANRLQAWAAASGHPDVKSLIIATMEQGLALFEQSQNVQTYAASYTPIAPT